jgi:hypothetical protein
MKTGIIHAYSLNKCKLGAAIEAPRSPVKTGSPPQFRRTGPLCSDKLRGMFCLTAVLRSDPKEVCHFSIRLLTPQSR